MESTTPPSTGWADCAHVSSTAMSTSNSHVIVFISRHVPTAEQHALAEKVGMKLFHVPDVDAFNKAECSSAMKNWLANGFRHFCVVNPALAMRVASWADSNGLTVWVFENGSRPVEGGKPSFFAKTLHRWQVANDACFGVFEA